MTDAPSVAYLWPTRRKPLPAREGKKGAWLEGLWTPYDTSGEHTGPSGKASYIRADRAQAELQAAVAAAYDDAAKIGVFWANAYYQIEDDKHISDPIRTRTPVDAQAALEARDKRVWNKALREAISIVSGYGCCHVPDEIQDAILALMEGSDDE